MSLDVIIYGILGLGLLLSSLTYFAGRRTGRRITELEHENENLKKLYDAQQQQFQFVESARDRAIAEKDDFRKRVRDAIYNNDFNGLFKDAPTINDLHPNTEGMLDPDTEDHE